MGRGWLPIVPSAPYFIPRAFLLLIPSESRSKMAATMTPDNGAVTRGRGTIGDDSLFEEHEQA